jgi:hypothetical protein
MWTSIALVSGTIGYLIGRMKELKANKYNNQLMSVNSIYENDVDLELGCQSVDQENEREKEKRSNDLKDQFAFCYKPRYHHI